MSYKNVAHILAQAKDAVSAELAQDPDAAHHKLKIEASLQREIEYINLLTGIGDVSTDTKQTPGPATTMGGKDIKRPASAPTSEDLEPQPRKVEELRARVETLWNTFVTRDSKELLKEVDDTTIRGVAKKAKMKVTKEDPEVITLQFIEEIKDAILMEKARQVAADEQRENEKNQPGLRHPLESELADSRQAVDIDKELSGDQGSTSQDSDEDIDGEDRGEEKNNLPEFKNPPPPPPAKKKNNTDTKTGK